MKTKILIPLAGVALFCACKGAGSSSETADTVATVLKREKTIAHRSDANASAQVVQKLVKTASMRFKVKNAAQTSSRIAALTANYGGTVMYHTIKSVMGDSTTIRKTDDSLLKITILNTRADMTVRIPAAKVESFVDQVAEMCLVINSLKFEVNDKTFDYLSTRLKLKNQQARAASGEKGTANLKDPDNLMDFKNHMVDQQVSNLKTDDSVKNAVIALSFYEGDMVHKELVANPDLAAYNLPLSNRLGTSIKNGWAVFVDFMVELANFWILAPIAGLIWFAARYYNKKKKVAEVAKS